MVDITQARELNYLCGGGIKFKGRPCAHTRGPVNGSLKELQSERNPTFSEPDRSIDRCSHLPLTWKGHGMADLRRQRTCLSGSSNMLINWSPERIYGGDMRAALPLATQ